MTTIHNHNIKNQRAPSGHEESSDEVPEPTCAPSVTGAGVGNFTGRRAERFKRFAAGRMAVRKLPGHCGRCGKVHAAATRQCPQCLAYQSRYRGQLSEANPKLTAGVIVAMVKQCRREVSKLREIIKQMKLVKSEHYNAGYRAGLRQRRDAGKYVDAMPTISRQELSEISHVYDTE